MPALTTVITHATGDVYPASDWNTYNRDNVNYLIAAGADLASAATITPTNEFHGVTGVTTIDNLTPATPVAGQRIRLWIKSQLTIRNNGGGTGNIRTVSGFDRVVAANETVEFMYDAVATVWREVQSAVGLVKLWDSVDAGVTLPTASIATPTLPQAFKHLRIVATLWSDQAGPQDVLLTINSDVTNANYLRRLIDGGTAMGVTGAADRISGMLAGRSAGTPSASEVLIPNYSVVRARTYRSFSGYIDSAPITHTYDGFVSYSVASAISTLAFSPVAGNFILGSRITVYGEAG